MRRKIIIISILLVNLILISSNVYAFDINDALSGAIEFESGSIYYAIASNIDFARELTYVFEAVGTVIAVCVGIVIAISFMTDGTIGKANAKLALTPYIIGCCILFGAYGIWSAMVGIAQGITTSPTPGSYIEQLQRMLVARGYEVKPIEHTPVEEKEPNEYETNEIIGGGLGTTGVDWNSLSKDDQEFINGIIDSCNNETVKDVLIWCKSRLGFGYEREDDPSKYVGSRTHGWLWSGGGQWDKYLELPDLERSNSCAYASSTSIIHCGFDCSSYTSRAYYSCTAAIEGSQGRKVIFPEVETNKWPLTCSSERDSAKNNNYIDVAYGAGLSKWPYNTDNAISIYSLKDYLQPGDVLISHEATHSMMFVGWNGDKPMIMHSSGGGVAYAEETMDLGMVIRPIDWKYNPTSTSNKSDKSI